MSVAVVTVNREIAGTFIGTREPQKEIQGHCVTNSRDIIHVGIQVNGSLVLM